ncbi:hypothetical protein EJ04DRAFT_534654 [Polyplosphaeria fusca]|uniref:Uncharacterized protein n=1 Tax=Polyplosphaeria fusca TaxID=682080 RepID=A0A9P4V004_9PLEO|nr:hypothetical protein EJ04DRAFT_534654 [Polyplosphaeria fusca]
MNATSWDNEAEAYLRMVYSQQASIGKKGGFPSAFPSTLFEISWVLDTLLEAGFDRDDFLLEDIRKLTVLLETNLKSQAGICQNDLSAGAARLEPQCRAYAKSVRNRRVFHYIVKCASFLSKTWMHNDGPDKWHTSVHYPMMLIAQAFTLLLKRWGKNELDHDAIPTKLVYQDVPRTLLDILSQTMGLQQADGSWESKREVTAYAILTLAPLLSLPWVDFLKPEGIACMYRGKAYLEDGRSSWREAEVLWIEKTAYSSKNLAHAYCLAASKIVVPMSSTSHRITELFPVQMSKKMARMLGFFAHVAPFSEAPKWKLQLSLLQSAQYASALKEARYAIFPRMEKASDEKYQEYIPFTWIGCRDHLSSSIPGEALWEMMLISMFNFQVDAFMETTAWDQYKGRLPELKAFILKKVLRTNGMANGSSHAVNGDTKGASNGVLKHEGRLMNGDAKPVVNGNHLAPAAQLNGDSINVPTSHNGATKIGASADDDTNESNGSTMTNGTRNRKDSGKGLQGLNGDLVEETLTKFVNHALQHPKVLNSPPSMRAWLAHEMQTFLLAHITHMEDCIEMAESSDVSNDSATWSKPRTTFFNWVKTTSADHTSCPYSFVFFLCLIGEKGKDMIATIQQRYALEDACHHLATMCRQYNDFGSVVRDQEERNLNSVNFPEFVTTEDRLMSSKELTERRKSDLLAVAEYERRCLARVIGELDESLDAKTMQKLALFIQVTDLYGQIYVARDIGIRHMEAANPRRKE